MRLPHPMGSTDFEVGYSPEGVHPSAIDAPLGCKLVSSS